MRRLVLFLVVLVALSVTGVAAQDEAAQGNDPTDSGFLDQFLVTEVFPSPDSRNIATDAVVTAIFNRPVVPLLSVEEMAGLAQPLSFTPEVSGQGEWINTSIYMFRPDQSWSVGTRYTVSVDPTLIATDGMTLSELFSWSFSTVAPTVTSINPIQLADEIRLDRIIQMNFNAPVDRDSLEENFYLRREATGELAAGTFEWNKSGTGFSFTPDENLQMASSYMFGFDDDKVYEVSGRVTFPGFPAYFQTVPFPAIVSTDPYDGESNVRRSGFTLYFASPMDQSSLPDLITIDPEPYIDPDFYYRDWSDALSVSFPTEPSTKYTITVAPGTMDVYGNVIDRGLTFSYTTGPYPPDVNLHVPSRIGFYNAYREQTQLFVTHRNVSRIDLELYRVDTGDFIRATTNNDLYAFSPLRSDRIRTWSIESQAPENTDRYELLNLGMAPDTTCTGSLRSRVQVGDSVIVITDPDPLRARSQPPDGEIVDLLYRDYVMPIVGGPVCADDLLWWQVELRTSDKAWIAESDTEEYFIDVQARAQSTEVQVSQDDDNQALPPGVYFLEVESPETNRNGRDPLRHFLMVSTANLTVKMSFDSVTVWVTDVQTGLPIADAPVDIYDDFIQVIGSGVTDADGIAQIPVPHMSDLYDPLMAVLKTGDHFGLGLSNWSDGVDPWRFGLNGSYYATEYQFYLYTDRPIYRPDQPVYFRGVMRNKDDVTYTPPNRQTVPVQIYDNHGDIVYDQELPITEFGTFSDTFQIGEDAPLGSYRIDIDLTPEGRYYPREGTTLYFDVAEYRLPEFQVKVTPDVEAVVQGGTVSVVVDSKYFFGGPVSDALVTYNVAAAPYSFRYSTPGKWYDFTDYNRDAGPGEIYGSTDNLIASGEGMTDALGLFTIEFPADLEDATQSQTFTIEAVVNDESNQYVAGRTSVIVHQGEVYIGARPTQYVGTAGQDTEVEFIAVDWDGNLVAEQAITVEIVERHWSSVQEEDPFGRTSWTWEVEELPIAGGRVETDDNGAASFSFVPPSGGTFKINITTRDSMGNEVRASTFMWVSSREYVSWRQQNSNRIDLITDADTYNVGDTAKILIASPFQGTTEALITVERGSVLITERVTMENNSYVYDLPITADFAPNVYVAVMLIKGVDETNPVAAFRMGMAQIAIDNSQKELHIDITPNVDRAGPGDTVTYTLAVTDYAGNPVRAEVGVGLTDLASLSLRGPNSGPILDRFYGPQPVSVRTATALTINADQITQTLLDTVKGGGGGYGEGGIFDIREEFVDTAYWNAMVVTNNDGLATFDVTMPDNLTTWRLDARAVTSGVDGLTLVGQDTFDLLSTKPVLIRPVTPRFFIVGDQLSLTAVVNNNSGEDLDVAVTLEAYGVTFDDQPEGNRMTQNVTIPADGRAQVQWPVTVDLVEDVELIYYAASEDGTYTDASRPVMGRGENRLLPVYRYEVPEIVGTGGTMREAGSRTEAIQLWDVSEYTINEGELTVKVDASLAGATLEGLDYLRYYPYFCVEQTVSRFLPNVMTYRALQETGHEDPKLESQLNEAVSLSLQRLYAEQKVDGGWGWYSRDESSALTTAYALIGLVEARDSGYPVDADVIRHARQFLRSEIILPGQNVSTWRLNRQVFVLYALARAGTPDVARSSLMYDYRDRLSLYAKAMLATALDMGGDDSGRIDTLISDLLNDAILSANGAHWEESYHDWWNWNTNTRTTAMVLQTLIRFRPESELIPNVVRWLMVARTADHWETTQETAWAVMALTDWMVASGELMGNYDFSLDFNGETRIEGTVTPETIMETSKLVVEVAEMLQDEANTLTFTRTEGEGNMYYTAYLRQFLPVPEIEPLNRGIILERRYVMLGDENRAPVTEAHVGELVEVRLTIVVPNSLHYVVIEDFIPAGSDAVNPGLLTSQQIGTRPGLDTANPLRRGWGWWWFSNIEFHDEKVVLTASYLPAGTYEYVYTIRPGLPGTYNVIPPVGFEFYFPDVYGRGAGSSFTILPPAQ